MAHHKRPDPQPLNDVHDLREALARERERGALLERRNVALEEALRRSYKMLAAPRHSEREPS